MEYFKGKHINVSEKRDCNVSTKKANTYEYGQSTDSDSPASENRPPHCQKQINNGSQVPSSSLSPLSPSFSNTKSQKRRRRSSLSSSVDKDTGAPPAKRPHTSSESSSSIYSSPPNDFNHDPDTRSSSACMSTLTDFDLGTPSSETEHENDDTMVAVTHSPYSVSSKEAAFDEEYGVMTPREVDDRMCPLPALSWANASDVWSGMCRKDLQASCLRDAEMLDNHPGLQLRMRAILLDWLIEVCEVYKLHRETFYLAVDFLDRYLSKQVRVQKTHLQLIGITCLFIAAKVEEIYPPKINEFAYVTDGACQEDDILQHELILLHALDWRISPLTTIGWLGVYMQLNVTNRTPDSLVSKYPIKSDSRQRPRRDLKRKAKDSLASSEEKKNDAFIYPQFSGFEFAQTAQLLDLCSMDVANGAFPYSIIAAAAISHTFNRETAIRVSGYDWAMLDECARWMEPFFTVIRQEAGHLHLLEQNEQISSKHGLGHIVPNLVTDDSHIIQTHTTNMDMFERAFLLREQSKNSNYQASPGITLSESPLTPPSSSCKNAN